MIILSLTGNIGVAAYGVVANTSLVAVALFNGIAQGSQPLISKSYGTGQKKEVHEVLRMALMTSLCLSTILVAFIYLCAPQVTAVFNGEHNATLAVYAEKGCACTSLVSSLPASISSERRLSVLWNLSNVPLLLLSCADLLLLFSLHSCCLPSLE